MSLIVVNHIIRYYNQITNCNLEFRLELLISFTQLFCFVLILEELVGLELGLDDAHDLFLGNGAIEESAHFFVRRRLLLDVDKETVALRV